MNVARRRFVGSLLVVPSLPVFAQSEHAGQGGLYERLQQPGRIDRPDLATQQNVFDSLAPKAANPGRWMTKAPLPVPRSEMAWATADADRMHLVGGYGEQRVDRPYHDVYDPVTDRWTVAAPLPRGANHVGVAFLGGRLYAVGGFVEQNRRPHAECFFWDRQGDRWERIAALPNPCGSMACVALDGRLHGIAGAIGDTSADKRSIDWHVVYDPKTDRWERRAPLPTGRDHVGALAVNGVIHVIGGRGVRPGARCLGAVRAAAHATSRARRRCDRRRDPRRGRRAGHGRWRAKRGSRSIHARLTPPRGARPKAIGRVSSRDLRPQSD